MALVRVKPEEAELRFGIRKGTDEVEPAPLFPGQDRVERAFSLALETEREGYNVYVSGPESVGRTTFTLRKLREKAREKPPPEDVCYYHDFHQPMRPRFLLLPPGTGRDLSRDVDELLEKLKQSSHRIFESKEFEEEREKRVRDIEAKKEELLRQLTESARRKGLGVIMTPAGFRFLPLVRGQPVPEAELLSNPVLRESYQRSLREFEVEFRDYLRALRDLDHRLADQLRDLRERTARYLVEGLLYKLEEKYRDERVREFLKKLSENLVANIQFFVEWKFVEDNLPLRRFVENNINLFRLKVVVDNGGRDSAPVVHEEMPTFRSLFGYVSHRAEMGILYADFSGIEAGSLHRARGGYLVLRASDVLRNPLLWTALKRVLLHKKIYVSGYPFEEAFPLYVGINPEPVPYRGKIFLIGDPLTFHLLSLFDPEFTRLFKIKAEFASVVKLSDELVEKFPSVLKEIVSSEGLRDLTPDGVEEVLRYASSLAGDRRRISVVFGYITDVLREADALAKGKITGEDIRRAVKEKVYRSNLIEERIREMIAEGKIIIETQGKRTGQVNGLSVLDLGDLSFGKPTRITATAYPGEKGIVNVEREVELSGPIHSKGVMILTGYIGMKYGRRVPLALSCNLTFEQSYDEVEGDSASVAELVAVLSAICGVPLRQDVAVTGSLDQRGNLQPVGGVREKVEGFWRVCREKGLTGTQGVVLPSRNRDNLILDPELVEDLRAGRFHLYLADTVDDVLELLTGISAAEFHRRVRRELMRFARIATPKRR